MAEKEIRPRILIIDDEPDVVETMAKCLKNNKVEVFSCTDPVEGIEIVRAHHPDLVITDVSMPGMGGFDVLHRILEIDPRTEVILLTGNYSTESAVQAIRLGAADYWTKPLNFDLLRQRADELADQVRQRHSVAAIQKTLLVNSQAEGIIGQSPAILEVLTRVRRVAPHFRNLLITGPSGTGKELLARVVHRMSPLRERPLVTCNCAAIVETLFESEMFGHVKGAFTGATSDKAGLFETADGGSIFLDEVGELSLPSQAKLLRVLQNQECQRVGSTQVRKIQCRVIAATNQDLPRMVLEGKFREDLFYRLSMVSVRLPSLLERKEDLPLLQSHLIQKYSAEYGRPINGLTRRVQLLFSRHTWPGNVRELENVIAHGCMVAEDSYIDLTDLPEYLRQDSRRTPASSDLISLAELQRRHIVHVLTQVKGNKREAARILGIGRATLYRMLQTDSDSYASG